MQSWMALIPPLFGLLAGCITGLMFGFNPVYALELRDEQLKSDKAESFTIEASAGWLEGK